MISDKIFSWLASTVICPLLLIAGCGPAVEETAMPQAELQIPEAPTVEETVKPQAEPQVPKPITTEAVTLALKFTEQDLTTYKTITESERSVKFGGPLLNENTLKGGHTGNRAEIVFTQQIQSVNDKGNAVAKITIEALKYVSKVKDDTVLDFDSSRKEDRDRFLGRLIGQSYTIEITPAGQISRVTGVSRARAAVRHGSPDSKTALRLLSSEAIKLRHAVPALPPAEKEQLRTGDNWSSTKAFSFGLMGSKSYEKIYTLKKIKDTDGHRTAVIKMDAIPSSEMAEQLHKEQKKSSFSEMFDNTETYTGLLKLDLPAGKVEKYLENLRSEWIVVDPSIQQEGDKEPANLTMAVTRFHSLEKID